MDFSAKMAAKDTRHALISNKPEPCKFKQLGNNIFLYKN